MELSSKVEYALIALLELAIHYDQSEPIQIRQIAERQSIPDRYLEQVFAVLRHAGIVRSQRGNKGGYLLAREPWQITLLEVFSCLEDSKTGSARDGLSINQVIVREIWQQSQQSARTILRQHTLRDLCQQRDIRQRISSMYYI
jgi:Rrf2 family protein